MLIQCTDDWCDEDGNDLFDDIVSFDWKEWSANNAQYIANVLDKLGIDVVEYETGGDFYLFRFVKQDAK
jgi:hypothetical protein